MNKLGTDGSEEEYLTANGFVDNKNDFCRPTDESSYEEDLAYYKNVSMDEIESELIANGYDLDRLERMLLSTTSDNVTPIMDNYKKIKHSIKKQQRQAYDLLSYIVIEDILKEKPMEDTLGKSPVSSLKQNQKLKNKLYNQLLEIKSYFLIPAHVMAGLLSVSAVVFILLASNEIMASRQYVDELRQDNQKLMVLNMELTTDNRRYLEKLSSLPEEDFWVTLEALVKQGVKLDPEDWAKNEKTLRTLSQIRDLASFRKEVQMNFQGVKSTSQPTSP